MEEKADVHSNFNLVNIVFIWQTSRSGQCVQSSETFSTKQFRWFNLSCHNNLEKRMGYLDKVVMGYMDQIPYIYIRIPQDWQFDNLCPSIFRPVSFTLRATFFCDALLQYFHCKYVKIRNQLTNDKNGPFLGFELSTSGM